MRSGTAYIYLLLVFLTFSCGRKHCPVDFERVEAIMPQHPDSALALLDSCRFDVKAFSQENRAHYYLLRTEAEDKCYKEPVSDSLINIATEYYDKSNDLNKKAKAWYYKGRVNNELHHLLKAQDCYLQALRDNDKIDDHALLGRINNNLGMLYARQGVYEKTVMYQDEAVKHFNLIKDSLGQAYSLRDLGRAYTSQNNTDNAISSYIKAIEYMGTSSVSSSIYAELSSLYMLKADYIKADACLKMINKDSPESSLIKGNFFLYTDQIDSAKYYYEQSAESMHTRTSATQGLARIAAIQGEYKKSMLLYQQYELMRDSLFSNNQSESIRKVQQLYDYKETEQKLLTSDLTAARLKLLVSVLLFVIFMCIVILALGYFIHKSRKHRIREQQQKIDNLEYSQEKLNARLQENKKHIEQLEKNKSENQLLEKELIRLRKEQLEKENQEMMDESLRRNQLEQQIRESEIYIRFRSKEIWKPDAKDWAELYEIIDLVYNNFTFRMQELIDLSDRELRIVCLIKIGVSPGIIAQLLFSSATSISMTRKRLYQKIYRKPGSAELLDQFIKQF